MAEKGSDAYMNEVIVAGGLWAVLGYKGDEKVESVMVDGQATNELYVWPKMMRSRYRVTVTLDPEPLDG